MALVVLLRGVNVGGHFNNSFVANPDGTYRVVAAADTGAFNDLELYLMGLLPKDSVRSHTVFENQAQFPLAPGATAVGPATPEVSSVAVTSTTSLSWPHSRQNDRPNVSSP